MHHELLINGVNGIMTGKNTDLIRKIAKNSIKPVHFIGLGGIGMSGLARFLIDLGYKVSGSDIKESAITASLSTLGATVYIGHTEKTVEDASIVVASTAIKENNPELAEAKRLGIPVVHRSEVLEALMSGLGRQEKQVSVGVSGTHGKTTTSGMVSLIFEDAGVDPSFIVGGQMPYLNVNSKFGRGQHFIAELDESDGTIVNYMPDFSIIANLEFDHPDHYKGGFDQLIETFKIYVNNLESSAKIIINADCAGNRELLKHISHPGIILYSVDETNELHRKAKYTVSQISSSGLKAEAIVYKESRQIGKLKLNIPGLHNISNALAALAAALECGISFEKAVASLERFTGMKRRFQLIGCINNASIIDDYAHHPTEILATLKASSDAVKSAGKGRVVAVFQPHRYSRLSALWNEFLKCFNNADVLYVTDVYSAGENIIQEISSKRFAEEVSHPYVSYIPGSIEHVADLVYPEIRQGDIVISLGAGDITKLGGVLIRKHEQCGAVKA